MMKLIRYCRLHLFRDPKYFFLYFLNYLNPNYIPNIHYFEPADIRQIITSGQSIIRLGDGEIYIMNGGGLPFQKHDPKLAQLLLALVKNYSNTSPYVLCVNKLPLAKTNKELKELQLLSCWLPSKVYFNQYFNKQARYLDAAMFYFHETFPMYFEDYFKTKKVLFISNKKYNSLISSNGNIPFKIWNYIETKEQHSYEDYDEIKNEILSVVPPEMITQVVILMAFGPASKAMAYDLSDKGFQVIDVGQGVTAAYTGKDHNLSRNINVLK